MRLPYTLSVPLGSHSHPKQKRESHGSKTKTSKENCPPQNSESNADRPLKAHQTPRRLTCGSAVATTPKDWSVEKQKAPRACGTREASLGERNDAYRVSLDVER